MEVDEREKWIHIMQFQQPKVSGTPLLLLPRAEENEAENYHVTAEQEVFSTWKHHACISVGTTIGSWCVRIWCTPNIWQLFGGTNYGACVPKCMLTPPLFSSLFSAFFDNHSPFVCARFFTILMLGEWAMVLAQLRAKLFRKFGLLMRAFGILLTKEPPMLFVTTSISIWTAVSPS